VQAACTGPRRPTKNTFLYMNNQLQHKSFFNRPNKYKKLTNKRKYSNQNIWIPYRAATESIQSMTGNVCGSQLGCAPKKNTGNIKSNISLEKVNSTTANTYYKKRIICHMMEHRVHFYI
jgi:hypothetical protein